MGWLAKLVENTGAIFSINIEQTDNTELIESLDARIRDASSLSKIAKNESIKQLRDAEVKEELKSNSEGDSRVLIKLSTTVDNSVSVDGAGVIVWDSKDVRVSAIV